MSRVQYTKDGRDIDFATISSVVERFAINGYYDVPGRNLQRIVEQRHPNISTALPMAPSPGTRTMLEYLQSNGYDWRWETNDEPACVPPDYDR